MASVMATLLRSDVQVELEADQEHVENHAELRDDAEKGRRLRRVTGRPRPPGDDAAEQRRAEQDAADHLAHDGRLVESREQGADQAGGHHDDRQGHQDAQQHAARHYRS